MTMTEQRWGGARPGAGKPRKTDEQRVGLTLRIPESVRAKWRGLLRFSGLSGPDLFCAIVHHLSRDDAIREAILAPEASLLVHARLKMIPKRKGLS